LAYKASLVEQLGEEERFGLFSLPTRFGWDTSENLLDPVSGRRLTLQFTPFYEIFGDHLGFVKGYATYSQYVKLTEKPLLVLAGRSAFGSMVGASRNAIPADERFYAGGGRSIRGYAYQSVGPLEENKPTGGRSLMEVSLELRTKVTDTIGFVAFLDGGNASSSVTPDPTEPLRWGAGAGIRYFTPVGPLRLDVAVPLNRRDKVDDRFHVYMSLGQAF
jgi:translocation and assembly module TamA